jgi:hypothetical protein
MHQFMDTTRSLAADIVHYAQHQSVDLYQSIGQRIATLSKVERTLSIEDQSELGNIMTYSVNIEPIWGLLAGICLWSNGCRKANGFLNVWNLARYAGIQSRFSKLSPQEHLDNSKNTYIKANKAAICIIEGNALRQLHKYADAESAYLQGLTFSPDNPFLKFRLVDLWLITYQHARANQMLASLKSRYLYALEMLFALPVPDDIQGPDNQLPPLDPGEAEIIWLVAADPVYLQRYGVRLAKTVANPLVSRQSSARVRLHVHVIKGTDCATPIETLQAMAAVVPINITQRTLDLSSFSSNRRAALFSCERFLFLAEMITKYNTPLLVTDIDIECLNDPYVIFEKMNDADIAYSKFGIVRDAWDLYPATALFVKPTEATIYFFKRLSGMLIHLLDNHPRPWFVDQISLFRLIENGLTPAKFAYFEQILTDTNSPNAYFQILHGSWEKD